ncbi:MAG: metallophosphoesterase [Bacteroidales bacterium]|nr:metallophosphoesterase [Bacteroidales bacterium]
MKLFGMLIVLLIFAALNIYLYIRGWQALPANTAIRVIYPVLFILASTAVFVAVFLGSRLPLWLSRVFDVIGGYWMILFVFMVMAALLADLLRLAHHYRPFFPDWITVDYARARLYYLITVIAVLVLISVIGYLRFDNPRIKELDLKIVKENATGDSFTIVAASDIHLGNLIRRDRLAGWVELINRQKPDFIILVGDLFDHNMKAVESQDMRKELLRLDAKYGVFAVPGNHDYYAGIDHALKYMESSGIVVLRDQALTIGHKMVIVGRDDLTNQKRKSLEAIMTGVNRKLPIVVVDHQPLNIAESVKNQADVHISGHTHNGQIFPVKWVVSRMYELAYGYAKMGSTHVYVSSGLGLWGAPLRLGSTSEIVKMNVRINE